jgi:AcrR family transcriptional regulator
VTSTPTSTALPRRLSPEARRRQLLDIACTQFAERGFHRVSMDDLARAAGVTKPVIYQHFPSKRALFVAVLEDVSGRLLTVLDAASSRAGSGPGRVVLGFAAYFRFVESNRDAFRILFGASARNDPDFGRLVDRVLHDAASAVSFLIDIRVSSEHRMVLAHALVGMAEATSRHALAGGEALQDPDQLAQWVAELAWTGLRGLRVDERAEAVPVPE